MWLPVVNIDLQLFGHTYQVEALCYDHSPVDMLLGKNCPGFNKILAQAERLADVFLATRQQAKLDQKLEETRRHQEKEMTPLLELLGKEYDFPQLNLSLQESQYPDQRSEKVQQSLARAQFQYKIQVITSPNSSGYTINKLLQAQNIIF